MKRTLYTFFLLISTSSFATDWNFHPDSAFRHSVGFASGYFFASNAITNEFAEAYFRNKFIDDDLKNGVSKNLESSNRFGLGFNYNIQYSRRNDTLFKLPHSFYSISVNGAYHTNSEFSKDAFEMFFRGNKGYEGKKADLNNFTYNQLYYQNLNFTFGHMYKRELNVFEYSGGLSLIKGQRLYEISAPTASIYTADGGEYLDVVADITIRQSDSTKTDLSAWNGTGASANFYFSWKDKKNNVLNFSIDNLGFIEWNKNTAYVRADTAFRYEGVDVSDLFLLTDSVKETISLDSSLVEPYLSVKEKKSYAYPLPSLASLSYIYNVPSAKMDIEANINYMFFGGYTLQESLIFGFTFNNIHRLSVRGSYGGYTGFQAGLAYKVFFLQNWMLQVRSDYLLGILDKKNGHAQGAFVSLTAYF